jgi:hypothetical protein
VGDLGQSGMQAKQHRGREDPTDLDLDAHSLQLSLPELCLFLQQLNVAVEPATFRGMSGRIYTAPSSQERGALFPVQQDVDKITVGEGGQRASVS